ncbi:hypothetical protein Q9233_000864 [Columba guinea]|nr:hypothetical protein Q9233_000864 [Columba guinea]
MEDGFSSYSSLYDTSSLLQFCNADSSQGEEEDPQDLRMLRNLNGNTLAGASSHFNLVEVRVYDSET